MIIGYSPRRTSTAAELKVADHHAVLFLRRSPPDIHVLVLHASVVGRIESRELFVISVLKCVW